MLMLLLTKHVDVDFGFFLFCCSCHIDICFIYFALKISSRLLKYDIYSVCISQSGSI